jgi:long-chain-fatty-acid--CoA ligase ACSBG
MMEQFKMAVQKHGDKPALKVERPCPPQGTPALPDAQWATWTYRQYYEETRTAAKGMVKLGFQVFDTVNVWGFNMPEWHMSAIAAGFAGGKVGGLYPTDQPDTAAYKIVLSGGSVVVVEDQTKIDRIVPALNARGDARKIKAFVAYGFEPEVGKTVSITGCGDVPVISWQALLTLGKEETDEEIDKRCAETDPGSCCCLVFTSGTTGEPKAVMLSHDSVVYEITVVLSTLASHGVCTTNSQERGLSYLPLSHVAGKLLDICAPVVATSRSPSWQTVYYARPYDLKAGSIKDRLCVARPTMFLGVPLVWEKIADKLRAIGAANTGVKLQIATWAKGLGLAHGKNCTLGGTGAMPLGYRVANAIVLKNVKAALGLDCCKFAGTAAAPIRVDTLEYFASLGLNICELYGMSESVGGTTISTDTCHVWGSVGYPARGVELRVFRVDDTDVNKKTECPRAPSLTSMEEEFQGELCFRGRTIMMGYMANPDLGAEHVASLAKKNAEAIDADGYMHSGDKGMMTVEGMVKITGRYKELIIGEGGENIAPVPIEDSVKKLCDGINEVMMVGDKRKYNVALVTLKAVGANGEIPGTDDLDAGAKRVNPEVKTISAAMDDQVWIDKITKAITDTNNDGKVCPNQTFKIQKFTILPTNFSEEEGLLTPTKKLKRKEVEKVYATLIDAMYASKDTYVRYVSA